MTPNYDDACYLSLCRECGREFLHVWRAVAWCRPCLLALVGVTGPEAN